jgi:hypothetical protein
LLFREINGLGWPAGGADGEIAAIAWIGQFDGHDGGNLRQGCFFGLVNYLKSLPENIAIECYPYDAFGFLFHDHLPRYLIKKSALTVIGFAFFSGLGVEVGFGQIFDKIKQLCSELVFHPAYFFILNGANAFCAAHFVVPGEQEDDFIVFGGVFGQEGLQLFERGLEVVLNEQLEIVLDVCKW